MTVPRRIPTGFTLVELLIVVSILAIVVSVTLGGFLLSQKKARDGKRMTDLQNIRQALELYRADMGHYPSVGGGGWVDVVSADATPDLEDVLVPDYINEIAKDPSPLTTTPYRYQATDLLTSEYYAYCLETTLEIAEAHTNPCTPETDYNYAVRNP